MTLANIGTMRAGLLLGLGYLGLQLGHPQSAMAQPECSVATLRGTYIYSYDGFIIGEGGEQQPFAFSGIESYDGAGTMTGIFSGSTNGVIDEDVFYTGTYTVNADCTSELTTVDPWPAKLTTTSSSIHPAMNSHSSRRTRESSPPVPNAG